MVNIDELFHLTAGGELIFRCWNDDFYGKVSFF